MKLDIVTFVLMKRILRFRVLPGFPTVTQLAVVVVMKLVEMFDVIVVKKLSMC